jgi:NADH-quinone oxidoreductase subunit I
MTEDPHVRRRGVIALDQGACTSCMICVRECPVWCITLEAHQESVEQEGARRPKVVNVLDRFDIDYSACMFCGICVESCPHDALFWAPTLVPAEPRAELSHDRVRLEEWLQDVPGEEEK